LAGLLEARNLQVRFAVPGGVVHALSSVSLDVAEGKTVAIVGESGSGKTTAALAIMGIHPLVAGTIRFMDKPLSSMSGNERRVIGRHLQMVLQDPYASLDPRWTIEKIIAEPLVAYDVGTRLERRRRVHELLDLVALSPDAAKRYPGQLSGGQRQRVAIARALALNPRLVIADEPVSALDVSVRAQILALIKDIQSQTGVAFLVIAHDLAMVRSIADEIYVLYLGRVVESGPANEIIGAPRHPYTKALVAAAPDLERAQIDRELLGGEPASAIDPPKGCAFHPRCAMANELCRQETPPLIAGDALRSIACHLAGAPVPD
jgi:oligopeptide/dipeptide ABC transporter ATP-binding protein